MADGREIATAVHEYANGVIDERLPESGVQLEPDWALQDPDDYIEVLKRTVPAVLAESGIDPADVIGLGIDFTACTMLPIKADGTPLCRLPECRDEPHAWIKLWKHHAAQPEADRINEVARETGEALAGPLRRQDLVRMVLQQGVADPGRGARNLSAADRMLEAADWVIWQLTGQETRNSCTAGYKAIWQKGEGYPSREYLGCAAPGLRRRGRDQDERGHLAARRQGRRADRAGRSLDRAATRAQPWPSPMWTPMSPCPRPRPPIPVSWS